MAVSQAPCGKNGDVFCISYSAYYPPDGFHSYCPKEVIYDEKFYSSLALVNDRVFKIFEGKNPWGIGIDELVECNVECTVGNKGLVSLSAHPDDGEVWEVSAMRFKDDSSTHSGHSAGKTSWGMVEERRKSGSMELKKYMKDKKKLLQTREGRGSQSRYLVRYSSHYVPDGFHCPEAQEIHYDHRLFTSVSAANAKAFEIFENKNPLGLGVEELVESDDIYTDPICRSSTNVGGCCCGCGQLINDEHMYF